MTSIAMKMKVGTAATAIAIAASVPAVMAPATAAPIPLPATPIPVLDMPQTGGLFDLGSGSGDLLWFLNNTGGTDSVSTIWNPFQFFHTFIAKIISIFCYGGTHKA